MTQLFNFSPGPAVLPAEVLAQAAAEMQDWQGSGMSVMEMSHRGPEFISIAEQAEADLRELLAVPSDYRVLFMQGGAIGENAIVPLNLLRGRDTANYLITGQWSKRSASEAQRYAKIHVVADGAKINAAGADATGRYDHVPEQTEWNIARDGAYLHLCPNETIEGIELNHLPQRGDARWQVPVDMPLVADVSSNILSRPIDVTQWGCLYGGAQKNIGPSGLTVVIVRNDLIGQAHPLCPAAFDYKLVADSDSMFNTPPTWSIYVAGLVLQWMKRQGGLVEIERRNIEKSALLYDFIDASGMYSNPVDKSARSRMNVPFFLADATLDKAFLAGAKAHGLVQLKGHRIVGGMRASIYNAMPIAGVRALIEYMKEFERSHG